MEITDLLYGYLVEHERLAIAGFGVFSTTETESYIHPVDNSFIPAGKKPEFRLDKNTADEGLVDFLVKKTGKTGKELEAALKDQIKDWVGKLKAGEKVVFPYLGTLKLNSSGIVVFEPSDDFSLDKKFFGLQGFSIEALTPVKSVKTAAVSGTAEEKKDRKKLWLWLSAAAVLFLIAGGLWLFSDELFNSHKSSVAEAPASHGLPDTLERKAKAVSTQSVDTEDIEDSTEKAGTLENSDENIVESKEEEGGASLAGESTAQSDKEPGAKASSVAQTVVKREKRYYVIAGCFRSAKKAEAFLDELKAKGYDASIKGKTPGGLTRVCYGGYETWKKAASAAKEISRKENTSAWVQKIVE